MTKIYNWKDGVHKEELDEVVNIIKNDGIIVFPTETVYGIGGNATSLKVVNRVYELKQRPREKAINILVPNVHDIERYAMIKSDLERKIIENFMPGPITIILNKKENFGEGFTLNNNTIGIRIPNNIIIKSILEKIDFPIIAPSANISGMPSGTKFLDILKDFNNKVDVIIDGGDSKGGESSTIVKVENDEIKILRQGSITLEEILQKIKQ